MSRKPNVSCGICGKPIYRRPSQASKRIFCSRVCFGLASRKPHPCPVCQKEILASQNARTCSKACANKQRTGIVYDGTRRFSKSRKNRDIKRYLLGLRGTKCESCSYENVNILQVHHIIPKARGGTNNLNNLKILCPNCHYTEHLGDSREGNITGQASQTSLENLVTK